MNDSVERLIALDVEIAGIQQEISAYQQYETTLKQAVTSDPMLDEPSFDTNGIQGEPLIEMDVSGPEMETETHQVILQDKLSDIKNNQETDDAPENTPASHLSKP